MEEKNDKKEEIVDKSPNNDKNINLNTTQLSRKFRFLFFLLFIILTFLFNLEAMGLIDEEFKYKTFYLKMQNALFLLFEALLKNPPEDLTNHCLKKILSYYSITHFSNISCSIPSKNLDGFDKIIPLAQSYMSIG